MLKFKFNVTKEDIDAHVKNSFSEEEKEALKNVTFVPCNVFCNDDMDIEVTTIGVLDVSATEDKSENEQE